MAEQIAQRRVRRRPASCGVTGRARPPKAGLKRSAIQKRKQQSREPARRQVTEEQRSEAGCIGARTAQVISLRPLGRHHLHVRSRSTSVRMRSSSWSRTTPSSPGGGEPAVAAPVFSLSKSARSRRSAASCRSTWRGRRAPSVEVTGAQGDHPPSRSSMRRRARSLTPRGLRARPATGTSLVEGRGLGGRSRLRPRYTACPSGRLPRPGRQVSANERRCGCAHLDADQLTSATSADDLIRPRLGRAARE